MSCSYGLACGVQDCRHHVAVVKQAKLSFLDRSPSAFFLQLRHASSSLLILIPLPSPKGQLGSDQSFNLKHSIIIMSSLQPPHIPCTVGHENRSYIINTRQSIHSYCLVSLVTLRANIRRVRSCVSRIQSQRFPRDRRRDARLTVTPPCTSTRHELDPYRAHT